jgi:hypothetical protein
MLKCSPAIVLLIAMVLKASGELPPSVYKDLQANSPEALTILVEGVRVSSTQGKTATKLEITAEARVETIQRSASGLKPGDVIRIRYVHRDNKPPLPGPSEPEILTKNRIYPAFLIRSEKEVYTTAAGGYSFRPVK